MQKRRYLQVSLILLFAIGLMSLFWMASSHIAVPGSKAPKGPVIGNLGGVPVEVPRVYARFVEYDDDPHFTRKKGWAPPERTYKSSLRSFGFDVRFPDMASVDKRSHEGKNIYKTMWLSVSVSSGENYISDDSLNYMKRNFLSRSGTCNPYKCFFYISMPKKKYGLTGYTPKGPGIDVRRRDLASGLGVDSRDKNVYVYEEDEKVATFIRCSNMSHEAAPCRQYFNLGPPMRVHININYRKGLLPHWREIQQRVSELIRGFEIRKSNHNGNNTGS